MKSIKVFNLLNRQYVDVHILDTLCNLLCLCLLLSFHKAASIFAYFPCFSRAEFILQLTIQRSSVKADDLVNLALKIVLGKKVSKVECPNGHMHQCFPQLTCRLSGFADIRLLSGYKVDR